MSAVQSALATLSALAIAYAVREPLVMLPVVVLVVHQLLLARDLRSVARALSQVDEQRLGRPGRLLTSRGTNFMELVDSLRYRLHTMQSSVAGAVAQFKPLPAAVEKQQALSAQELAEELAGRIRPLFRAGCVGVLVAETGEVGVALAGSAAARRGLAHQLPELQQALRRGTVNAGVLDSSQVSSAVADFTKFGFPVSIAHTFASNGALLWLGYQAGQWPHQLEEQRAELLVAELEQEVSRWRAMRRVTHELEEARAAASARSEFIAHLSHDIRSPLNNIKAILNLAKLEQRVDDELVQVALSNCDSVAELVEDVLDYSRHNAGKLRAHREEMELGALLGSLVRDFKISANAKGLALSYVPLAEPVRIEADKRHMRRVLSNLLSNALKYTPKGEIQVELHCREGRAHIQVRDTGIGMSQEQLARLFQPFSRVHEEGIADGVGLGLYVSRVLTELNGGSLAVSSRPEQGSTFTLDLPLMEPSAERPPAQQLLVIDDDIGCATSLARLLRAEGFAVHIATSLFEARTILQSHQIGVVLCDDHMPDGGVRALLQEQTTKGGPAILAVTGETRDELRRSLTQQGALAVLLKPVDRDELVAVIGMACDARCGRVLPKVA